MVVSQEIPQPSITEISLKITCIKFHSNLTGVNEWTTPHNASTMTSSNGNIFHATGPLWGESTGQFPSQRPVMPSFDVFFDLHLNKRLSKQWRCQWFETPLFSLWCHCNGKVWPKFCCLHSPISLEGLLTEQAAHGEAGVLSFSLLLAQDCLLKIHHGDINNNGFR